jgi:hypothetical protein
MDIEHYLKSADDASSRVRAMVFTLATACILLYAAIITALPWGWPGVRVKSLMTDPKFAPLALGLTDRHDDDLPPQFQGELPKWQDDLSKNLIKAYVESTAITLPLFGARVDAYSLSSLSGAAFLAILGLLLLSLRSLSVSLRAYFHKAMSEGILREAYRALAARQVFTSPILPDEWTNLSRNFDRPALSRPTRRMLFHFLVILMPFVIFMIMLYNDLRLYSLGFVVAYKLESITTRLIALVAMLLLCLLCFRAWRDVDNVWDSMWAAQKNASPGNG